MKVWLLETTVTDDSLEDYERDVWVFETKDKTEAFIRKEFFSSTVRHERSEVITNLQTWEEETIVCIEFDVYSYIDKEVYIYHNELIFIEITVI